MAKRDPKTNQQLATERLYHMRILNDSTSKERLRRSKRAIERIDQELERRRGTQGTTPPIR